MTSVIRRWKPNLWWNLYMKPSYRTKSITMFNMVKSIDPLKYNSLMTAPIALTIWGSLESTFQSFSTTSVDVPMSPPITPTTPVSPKEYEIQVATIDDKEDILNFLREFFFKDEPLNKYLGLIDEDAPRCVELEDFSTKEMDNNLNLKAIHNGKIIGLSLNGFLKKGFLDEEEESPMSDSKFSKIVRLLERVGKESDVFARFPDAETAVTVKIISVNDAYRGQGIAKELINKTRELAKQIGAGFISVDCTSHFTALAVKKLGFELHYQLNYADHKENGEVVFKPELPHEAVTVYVQKI